MPETVLSKPGSIGLSIVGVENKFQIIANILMMGDRLLGFTTDDDDIIAALEDDDLDPSPDNIAKVRAFFKQKK